MSFPAHAAVTLLGKAAAEAAPAAVAARAMRSSGDTFPTVLGPIGFGRPTTNCATTPMC